MKPTFKPSVETNLIFDRLSKLDVGELVSYEELETLARKPIKEILSNCTSARRRSMSELNRYIYCVPRVGFKRGDDSDRLECGESMIESTRRKAKRAGKMVSSVEYDQLPKEKQVKHNVLLTVIATIDHFTRQKQTKLIEEKVVANSRSIPVLEMLDSFKGS